MISVPNVSFAVLDHPVISGRAEEPFVVAAGRSWTHARLLEEVGALAGVLRHLGVVPGERVLLDLADEHDLEAVLAALAAARLGGVVTTSGESAVVVCSHGSPAVPTGEAPRLVRALDPAQPVVEPDLDWAVMLRAGRTDPAPAAVLDAASPYSGERDVTTQSRLVGEARAADDPPFAVRELRTLLQA